jgi:hypothetical protein
MHQLPYTQQPVADTHELNVHMMRLLKEELSNANAPLT